MRRAIRVTFEGNGRHADERSCGKLLFQTVIARLALSQAQPPAVVVNHDVHLIRVLERSRGSIERSVVEAPFRRSDLPDELREVAPVLVVARPAAFGGEI